MAKDLKKIKFQKIKMFVGAELFETCNVIQRVSKRLKRIDCK